ncbi:MAG: hypothetical protein HY202_05120 [Nitrospirae bacterium]|nr:hypothetical protein [Nitrospirota bacterium]
MKKNKLGSMAIEEASDFFDEHDLFEIEGVREIKDIRFQLKKKKYIGVDLALYKKIRTRAKKLHIDESALIKEWLEEKVG